MPFSNGRPMRTGVYVSCVNYSLQLAYARWRHDCIRYIVTVLHLSNTQHNRWIDNVIVCLGLIAIKTLYSYDLCIIIFRCSYNEFSLCLDRQRRMCICLLRCGQKHMCAYGGNA